MTNILYWNIRQFGIRKINDPRGGAPPIGAPTYAQRSADRFAVIAAVINAAAPDIISIVEATTGRTNGDLATNTGGLLGSIELLNALRLTNPAAGWRMVPLLWLGSRTTRTAGGLETVAVLYRGVSGNVTRYFTGPNYWVGGAGGVSTDPATGVAAATDYPAPFNGFLAPARAIPGGSLYRGGAPEQRSAARIYYALPRRRVRGGAPPNFSRYGGFRPPYMTSFYEVNALTGATRTLTIFSIHSPPQTGLARTLMRYYGQTPEIQAAPGLGEIKILAGDFNLNFLNTGTGLYTNVYGPVTLYGYQSQLPTGLAPPGTAAGIAQFRGNFATHMSSAPAAPPAANTLFLWSDPGPPAAVPSYYPAYGYTSAADNTDSIDNILVRPAAAYGVTVLNVVTGTPFQAAVPANNAPLGAAALATQFTNPPPPPPFPPPPPPYWPDNPTAEDFNAASAVQFYTWQNYGCVYSTSDHFGLTTTIP